MATDRHVVASNTSNAHTDAGGPLGDPLAQRYASTRIFDIRQGQTASLIDDMKHGLQGKQDNEKQLPTLLLYDEPGLKLFEEITYLDEYYLAGEEIELLENHASDIAHEIAPNSVLIELGSG